MKATEIIDNFGAHTPSLEEIVKKHGTNMIDIMVEFGRGIEVEKEHTEDELMASEIARDHLAEMPDYYSRLSDMEKGVK